MRDELVMVVPRDALFAGGRQFHGFEPNAGPYLRTALEEYLFMPRRHAEQDVRYKQIIPYVTVCTSPVPGKGRLYLMFQRAGGGDPRLGRLYSIGLGGHVNAGDVLPSPLVFGVGQARRRLVNSPASARPTISSPLGRARARTAGDPPPRFLQAQRLKRRVRLDSSLREAMGSEPTARLHEHPLLRGLRRELREEVMFPPGATLSFLGAINDDSNAVGQVHFGLAFLLDVPAAAGTGERGPQGPVLRRRSRPFAPGGDHARRRAGVRLRREPGGTVQIGSLFNLDQVRAYAQAMETWSLLLLEAGVLGPA